MKILVVGSGGREHALAWKLQQSSRVDRIFCAPGNAGTAELGENVAIPANDLPAMVHFAKENQIGLTVIGPDDPLAAGIADLFGAEGRRVFGPSKSAARLESSKIFAKELMRKSRIPTARGAAFSKCEAAFAFVDEARFPLVIKADGLALGKGVIIAQDAKEARVAIDSMMTKRRFGDAGTRLLIEECLTGSECSLHALVDGKSYRMLATARDHKRAYDGDAGPNTGGMGAFSPADNFGADLQAQFGREVMHPLLNGLNESGVIFRGLLFPGLMVTADGPRVLEFNCRFGDPETQVILPRLKSDLLELLEATIDGTLDRCVDRMGRARGGYRSARLGWLSGQVRCRKTDPWSGAFGERQGGSRFPRRHSEEERNGHDIRRPCSGGDRTWCKRGDGPCACLRSGVAN